MGIHPDTRRAIEAALQDPDDQRSRAQLGRDHGVHPRTISRWATALGIDPDRRWSTADTRKATEAATDRRRALRSALADELLTVEIPRLCAKLATAEEWTKTVVVSGPDGAEERTVREDDAVMVRGMKDAHAAIATANRTTIDIDRHDTADGDDNAGETLIRLFDGLGAAYQAITGRKPTDESP